MATAGGPEAFDAAVAAMLDDARGWRLAEMRKRRGMTQEQVALRMGISVARISQIERGDVSTQDVLLSPSPTSATNDSRSPDPASAAKDVPAVRSVRRISPGIYMPFRWSEAFSTEVPASGHGGIPARMIRGRSTRRGPATVAPERQA
jgi:DNA-binding XRE family transcriptional regulator